MMNSSVARAEPLDQGAQQKRAREIVARSLQEEHRDLHVEEMPAALVRWTSGWVQRKSQEDETADAGQRRFGLCLGGHAAAERLASREQRDPRDKAPCQGEGGAHGRLGEPGRIRPPRAALHGGKLITQRGDPSRGKPGGDGREERVGHAGARPMGERQAGERLARHLQKSGDGPAVLEIDRQDFGIVGRHAYSVTPFMPDCECTWGLDTRRRILLYFLRP